MRRRRRMVEAANRGTALWMMIALPVLTHMQLST